MAERTIQMLSEAESVEWIQVANELEALMLEYSLIQRYKPRYNVMYRDDKSYPYLCLTTKETWPRAMIVRGRRQKGNRYFGPYLQAHAIRETLDHLVRAFPVRTCSQSKFARHEKLDRPCLDYHIERCSGPCVGNVDKEQYQEHLDGLISFLEGDTDELITELENSMQSAAQRHEFELAARLRDRLSAVKKVIAKQQMVGTRDEDFDVIGIVDDELEASVQVFFVRKGRVMGRRGFIVDKAEPLTSSQLISRIIERLYYEPNPIGDPKLVIVPELPDNIDLYIEWLSETRGSTVEIRVAQRGDKRELAKTVTANAKESFQRHRMKRQSDHNARSQALTELQDLLGLLEAPLRIECYDMSHIQGSDYVGSMVVVEDGLAAPNQYRRFKIRDVAGNDDFAAMEEVLRRRFKNYLAERDLPLEQRGRFSYPPQLLVVDGGKGQLSVAVRVLDELGLSDKVPVISLAKQFEEVFVPGRSEPIQLPRQSEALYMLQRIRDESHRFAVTYHRELRKKRMTRSILDDIAGLGPVRKSRLVKEFGGVRAVQSATKEQLLELGWLPEKVALAVFEKTHPDKTKADRPETEADRPETDTPPTQIDTNLK